VTRDYGNAEMRAAKDTHFTLLLEGSIPKRLPLFEDQNEDVLSNVKCSWLSRSP
jgi:hypothetical protein